MCGETRQRRGEPRAAATLEAGMEEGAFPGRSEVKRRQARGAGWAV